MKALIVADLHYNLRQFDWLLRVAGSYEAVILAGDLLDLAGRAELDTQIVVLGKYLARLGALTRVAVCSGNHDADGRMGDGEAVVTWLDDVRSARVSVDGDHLHLGEALITVCPWWDGPVVRERLDALLTSAVRPAGPWIWVHHVPPDAEPVSWNGHGYAGDSHLNHLIERLRPDLVVSGHVHDAPFRQGGSWVSRMGEDFALNPGRQLGALPSFIELDLEARTLAWVSLEDEARLALPAAWG